MIGTGSIGRRHVANLRELRPQARFALLREGGRQDEFARDLGAEVFATLADAIDWQPDIAILATPSDHHFHVLPALLDAQIATLIEKPVVIRPDHAATLAQRPGGDPPTQVGCVLRFLGAVDALRGWIDEGRLGTVARANFTCGQYLPDWRPGSDYRQSYSADAGRGGGVIFDLVHEIDLAALLFGECRMEHVLAAHRSGLELACEDVALIHLTGERGELLSIALDYVSRTPIRYVEVVGDMASARLDFIARRLTLTGPDGVVETVEEGFDIAAAYKLELAELLAAVEGTGSTRLPLAEGLRATRLAIAAHTHVHRGVGAAA